MAARKRQPGRAAKKALRKYKCETVRMNEESFSVMMSGRSDVKTFFMDSNKAFTDGRSVFIDPAIENLFDDRRALERAEDAMGLPRLFSRSPWAALCIITRALNIHETLHIIHTRFPPDFLSDKRCSTPARRSVLQAISNIIEDAYIEAVGCSEYDNLEYYLKFLNLALYFSWREADQTPPPPALEATEEAMKRLSELCDGADEESSGLKGRIESLVAELKKERFTEEYLSCIAHYALDPIRQNGWNQKALLSETVELFEKTKALIDEGAACGDPDGRLECVRKIFDVIEHMIPDLEEFQKEAAEMADRAVRITGKESHGGGRCSPNFRESPGKKCTPSRRLFTTLDGRPLEQPPFPLTMDPGTKRLSAAEEPDSCLEEFLKGEGEEIEPEEDGARRRDAERFAESMNSLIALEDTIDAEDAENVDTTRIWTGSDFDCAGIHRNITVEEIRPAADMLLKPVYERTKKSLGQAIMNHRSRLEKILLTESPETEEKLPFGRRISSKNLGDPKRKYWQKPLDVDAPARLRLLILIDGSGSMDGRRLSAAVKSSIILHETLKAHKIQHAIVEERAIYYEPTVEHRILVDFNGRDSDKYNIFMLRADDGTREGLSLYWAEKYINASGSPDEAKLIIVISDGWPQHHDGRIEYYPPVSTKDTKNAAAKIAKRGVETIAVALDDGGEPCYEDLMEIYPTVVQCRDLKELPRQILMIVAKRLKQGR